VPSEGGHADFAPRNELEIELLRHLMGRFGRVSYERVVSGPGLANLHRFLVETGRVTVSECLTTALCQGDPSAAVSGAALCRTDEGAAEALDLFARLYGAEAGNLALKALATGGLYVGGGIAPKILEKLRDGAFLEAFRHKGRLSAVIERIPVRVILEPRTALLGAARLAVEALGSPP
jgi:glucokinase